MPTIAIKGYTIASQNVRERRHWSANAREVKKWRRLIASMMREDWKTAEFRKVTIVAIRTRKIRDFANLVGGCKGLVDAMVYNGILADDSEELCQITYKQTTGKTTGVVITWEG